MDAVADQVQGIEYTLREIADQGLETFIQFEKPQARSIADLEILLAHAATQVSSELPIDECRQMFRLAIRNATAKHPDLPVYTEAMMVASLGLLPHVWRLTWDEYVEALYWIGRSADFLGSARSRSLLAQIPAGAYFQ